jgi:Fur family ferric uptake transcriptional regulator
LLSEKGDILKLKISGLQKRFDARTDEHFHFRCMECGGVSDIEPDGMEEVSEKLKSVLDRNGISGYTLEFRGCCGECTGDVETELQTGTRG